MTVGLELKPWNNLQQTLSSRICWVPGLKKALGWVLVIWGPGPRTVYPLSQNLGRIKMQIPELYLIPTESESLEAGRQDSIFFFFFRTLFLTSAPGDSYEPKVWDSALDHLIFYLGFSFLLWKWRNYVFNYYENRRALWKMLKALYR